MTNRWMAGIIVAAAGLAAAVRAAEEPRPAPRPTAPKSINEIITRSLVDGALLEQSAAAAAAETARRLWWPQEKLKVSSAKEARGVWTIMLGPDRIAPAVPMAEIVLDKHGLRSAKFLPGE